ncbi:MAG: transporter substrate-binding domain-containing protein [Salinarimonas sp.]
MQTTIDIGPVTPGLRDLLAPGGVLRAGTNLSNFLLVTGKTTTGDPVGVSPDMARTFADLLGVSVEYVTYPSPGPLADAAEEGAWDIGLIGAEPQRAKFIAFTEPYVEIEASYLVPEGSRFDTPQEVDAPGVRIAVTGRTAYALWLENNLRHAELVYAATFDETLARFRDERLDALACLRSRLVTDQRAVPGSRILPGRFMAVQQAMGVPMAKAEALPLVARFVKAARDGGLVAALIEKHGVHDLRVAKPG